MLSKATRTQLIRDGGKRRRAIHIDLSPAYIELARQRVGPMLCEEPPRPTDHGGEG